MKIDNNYREALGMLRELTNNWSTDSGVVPCADYGSCQIVEEILNKHYRKVEVKDLKEDNEYDLQYHVVYSQPSNIEENVNLKTKKYKQLDFVKNYSPDSSAINKQCDSDVASGSFGESIEKHDSLNDKIFSEDNQLKPEVKEKLLEIAKRFIDNLKEDGIEIKADDIQIVGSNASYNYTDQSDIDLHIIADLSIYKDNEDLAEKLYDAYRRLFNDKYDPTIYGHEVEVYVEPSEESNATDYTGEIAESGAFDKFNIEEDMNTENIVASYRDGELIDLYKAYYVDGLRTKNSLYDFVKQSKIYREANGPMRAAGFVFDDDDIMRTGVYWYNRDDDTYVQISPPQILVDDQAYSDNYYGGWLTIFSAVINGHEEEDFFKFNTWEEALDFVKKFTADPKRYFKDVYQISEDLDDAKGTWDISWDNGIRETTYSFDNRVEADDYYDELLALQKKPSMRGLVIKKSGKYNEE